MKQHAEDPACDAQVSKKQVVLPQRVVSWDFPLDSRYTLSVCQKVEEGEQNGEWFLQAEEALEGPFPVELHDCVRRTWMLPQSLRSDNVLACVVAFRGTCPEEEAEL